MLARAQLARSWEALGDVAVLAGRYAEAAGAYAHARPLAGAREGRARLLLKAGTGGERTGSYGEALRPFDCGLLAAERPPAGAGRLRHRTAPRPALAGAHHRPGPPWARAGWARLAPDS